MQPTVWGITAIVFDSLIPLYNELQDTCFVDYWTGTSSRNLIYVHNLY